MDIAVEGVPKFKDKAEPWQNCQFDAQALVWTLLSKDRPQR